MSSGNRAAFFYERGTVTFVDGKVTRSELVPAEEARRRNAVAREMARDREAAAVAARHQRISDGQAELARVEEDASFEERPIGERLSFWRDFQRRYPEVSVSDRIRELEQVLRAEAENRQQVELAVLDNKIAETKTRISEIANRSGMGRTALIHARRELAQLREALPELEKQREKLLRSAP
jgi:hypothetical protein